MEGRLQLRVADDGVGFDSAAAADGHGMASLKARADRLDATLVIDSKPGRGTVVTIDVPLARDFD